MCDRQTDRRTDGRTDRQIILITIPRLHYMQRGNKIVSILHLASSGGPHTRQCSETANMLLISPADRHELQPRFCGIIVCRKTQHENSERAPVVQSGQIRAVFTSGKFAAAAPSSAPACSRSRRSIDVGCHLCSAR